MISTGSSSSFAFPHPSTLLFSATTVRVCMCIFLQSSRSHLVTSQPVPWSKQHSRTQGTYTIWTKFSFAFPAFITSTTSFVRMWSGGHYYSQGVSRGRCSSFSVCNNSSAHIHCIQKSLLSVRRRHLHSHTPLYVHTLFARYSLFARGLIAYRLFFMKTSLAHGVSC